MPKFLFPRLMFVWFGFAIVWLIIAIGCGIMSNNLYDRFDNLGSLSFTLALVFAFAGVVIGYVFRD